MAILDRKELEQSPLADLHAIASELGIEGYRRLRREELIDALLAGAGDGAGGEPEVAAEQPAAESESEPEPVFRSRERG